MEREVAEGKLNLTMTDAGTKEGNEQADSYFGDGVYVRSVNIPAGTTVVGRLHLKARVCLVLQGKCTFINESRRKTVSAPWIGEFKAGSKTAVYAHTDTVWAACVASETTDPLEAVNRYSVRSHEEYTAHLLENKI